MKKLAIFLAIMLIPFSAFALDTISDNDLNDVTGQAGVSIYTNSIQIVKTDVTTTYTDIGGTLNPNSGSLSIVDNGSTTNIFFGGADPLMIDVVDMESQLITRLETLTSETAQEWDYATSGVMITLPDSVIIQNVNDSTKTYYTGTAGATADQMIQITKTGGTTTIRHADWATASTTHGDQVHIFVTAHDIY